MKILKIAGFLLAASPVTALADHWPFINNEGVLYCQIICPVSQSDAEFKAGVYPRHQYTDQKLTVTGKWIGNFPLLKNGQYQVSETTFASAKKICNSAEIKSELYDEPTIATKLANPDLSGVHSCTIHPKIIAKTGVSAYDLILEHKADL